MLLITYWRKDVVRKGSIYRNGVALNTETNLHAIECGMKYHTYKTSIPYQTPSPLHFMTSFQSESIEIVSFHTDTQSSGMDTLLNKHTVSISRQSPEDVSSIFLCNTLPRPHVILT